MEDLGTLSLNEVIPPRSPEHRLHICAEPAVLQQREFELLDVKPGRFVPVRVQVEITNPPPLLIDVRFC